MASPGTSTVLTVLGHFCSLLQTATCHTIELQQNCMCDIALGQFLGIPVLPALQACFGDDVH